MATTPGKHSPGGSCPAGGFLTLWLGKTIAGWVGIPWPAASHEGEEMAHQASPWVIWTLRLSFSPPVWWQGISCTPVNRSLAVVFKGFNRWFDRVTAPMAGQSPGPCGYARLSWWFMAA